LKSANHVPLHAVKIAIGSTMPIFVIEIMFEIVTEIGKPCSAMQKIVTEIMIEICMEQTRLFQCNWFHCAIFVIQTVIEFFRMSSACSEKILIEIDKKTIIERSWLFAM